MPEISRAVLFGKLNPVGYKAIESATVFCKMRGNPYVELVHWLHQILQLQDSDLHRIVKHFGVNPSRLAQDLTEALDRLPRGATSISDLSSHVEEATERGWVYATLMFGAVAGAHRPPVVRHRQDAEPAQRAARHLPRVRQDRARTRSGERFAEIVAGSPEEKLAAYDGSQLGAGRAGRGQRRDGAGADGQAGGAATVLGRSDRAGAQRRDRPDRRPRRGDPPDHGHPDAPPAEQPDHHRRGRRRQDGGGRGLRAAHRRGRRAAAAARTSACARSTSACCRPGASMKGEFENRLRQVIDEVQASPKPIILFIDEAHTLIGAGGAAGTGDAANLLKPALARGTLRTIGATTWAEYKKYIEKDPALTRRFQPVQVDEPGEEKAILMMRGVASTLEKHHKVQLLDEALEAAVKLSHRYIPARQLPDKSVSLLDTACARVAISQHAVPPPVEDSRRRIEALETELEILAPRARGRRRHRRPRGGRRARSWPPSRPGCADLEARWEQEKALVEQILELRARLRGRIAPVEGTGSELEKKAAAAAASAMVAPAPRQRRRRRGRCRALSDAERADALSRLQAAAGGAGRSAGRDAADPGQRRRAAPSPRWSRTGPASRSAAWSRTRSRRCSTSRRRCAERVVGQDHAHGDDRPAHPDLARRPGKPEQADRRVHAVRPVGRRQDRDGAGAGRGALRRRAERHHHQHERVPGGAHRLDPEGRRRPATSATARAAC